MEAVAAVGEGDGAEGGEEVGDAVAETPEPILGQRGKATPREGNQGFALAPGTDDRLGGGGGNGGGAGGSW